MLAPSDRVSDPRSAPHAAPQRGPGGSCERLAASARRRAGSATGLAALLAGALSAAAPGALAGDELLPVGASFKVNVNQQYGQRQAQVDGDPDGETWTVSWHSPLGADIYRRVLDGSGAPISGETKVNQTFQFMNQSEPEVCTDEHGNVMIAWSDYNGSDGDLMGIFGRVYDAAGNPKGPDFQVNLDPVQSQWEPKGDALPGGGFVMAWSGTADGDAFIRFFDEDGVPTSGDIQTNTITGNAQIDTAVAAGNAGTLLVAYEDFSGAGGAGTNIFVRAYTHAGVPLGPAETLLNSSTVPGDQKEPRIAADGEGRFIVVYEDRSGDGSGSAIWARRYSSLGAPLGPEFRVNAATAGHQLRPDVAADYAGNFVVSWEDNSTGRSVATLRRFDRNGLPLTGDVFVDVSVAGHQFFPSIGTDWAGEDLLITYAAFGGPGIPDGADDIYARRFMTVPFAVAGNPTPGQAFQLVLDLPSGAGLTYLLLPSLGTVPGIPLPDGRTLHLAPDILFSFALASPNAGGLADFTGVLDGGGAAVGTVTLPGNAALVGLTLHFAVVSLDLAQPTLAQQLRHVTDPLAVTIQ
jgi:hypothetical protein